MERVDLHTPSRIESLDLSFSVVTAVQAERLLHRVARGGQGLRELVLHRVDLAAVSPAALAAAAPCLTTLVLHRYHTTPEPLTLK